MSNNIKAIFNSLYIGTNVNNNDANVNITGKIATNDSISLGVGSYISFNGDNSNSLYGIKDNNGVLQYKNSGGQWSNFNNIVNGYINFPVNGVTPINALDQANGFGIRDNQGVLEFKNRTGTLYTDWTPLGTGTGGSGGSNNAGQLYFNPNNVPLTLTGGVEQNIILNTPMSQTGKIHCDVWEFVPSNDGNVDSTWQINKNDNNFVMYNYKESRTGNVVPSSTSGTITLTITGSSWTVDDVGLEFYGNNGQAVINTFINNSTVQAVVRKNFTNTNSISDWKLYLGLLDDDGAFKITSVNSFQGIYRIMPEGLVNMYGFNCILSQNFRLSDFYSYQNRFNNYSTNANFPDSTYGTNVPSFEGQKGGKSNK